MLGIKEIISVVNPKFRILGWISGARKVNRRPEVRSPIQ